MSRYYPVHLDLHGRLAVVVGGCDAAVVRVKALLDAGAQVRLVWPEVLPVLMRLAEEGRIEHRARRFQDEDLDGAFLVHSERIDDATHRAVWEAAERRGIPANVEDELEYCSFVNAAVVRQGDLVFTISTSGRAPALAVRIREELEERFGPHYARFLELARDLRAPLAQHHSSFDTRRELWYRLVDSEVLDQLRSGDETAALDTIREILGVVPSSHEEMHP